jgi:hypothetical protein
VNLGGSRCRLVAVAGLGWQRLPAHRIAWRLHADGTGTVPGQIGSAVPRRWKSDWLLGGWRGNGHRGAVHLGPRRELGSRGPVGPHGIILSLRRRRRRRLALTLLRLDHGKTGRRAEVLGGGRRRLGGRGRLILLGGHLLLDRLWLLLTRLLLTRLLLNKLGVLLLLLDVLRGGRRVERGGWRLRRAGERTGRRWVARGGLVTVVGFLRGWRVRDGARGLAVAVLRRAEHDQ